MKKYEIILFALIVVNYGCTEKNKLNKYSYKDDFQSITIGNQVWMTTNLAIKNFRNGDKIPEIKSMQKWLKAFNNKQPAWCYYENTNENGSKYGILYNWYAVNDPRGLAPIGWHIPSHFEWQNLIEFADKNSIELKSRYGWDGNYANYSDFSALPGGWRDYNGDFFEEGLSGYWWCSDQYDIDNSRICRISLNIAIGLIIDNPKGNGCAVRCVKDK